MEKAENKSKKYNTKLQALKKEEGQWRWKRHKENRQLDVENENLQVKKFNGVTCQEKYMYQKTRGIG